ncbi:LysR family transcriptional regulator [Variovorax sp. PAMC26660]|uniref:LysR family transcriptional regulator n=1 Tax=Variovorax sp. PAMC26660 TaxID=2762322 RepID=UPI00164DFCA0|nr:LysR family transcriptional regulator [Variovorax sp. PAMC26660]QNK65267.1 LysR family transcriptional regulator [Variovorax sp. PAMC26660]
MDLNLLTALDALLSTASVSAAAERMHLSAPAMSHTLARIREALGDPILVRAGRKLVPTPRAVALREPVRRLIADARLLMQPDGGVPLARVAREFTVRAPEGMGIVYGATLLAALRRDIPLARLRFIPESDSDAMALREGRIDLDVGALFDKSPEIQTALLYEQRIVGVVGAGHELLKARITPKRLAAQQHVAVTRRAKSVEPIDSLLAEQGCVRQIALTVPSAYGALMAAARSSLVACVPEPLARTIAASLGLEIFKLPVAVPLEQVLQAWHPRDDVDPAHRCLRDCVAAVSKDARFGPLKGRDTQGPMRGRAIAAHRALVAQAS